MQPTAPLNGIPQPPHPCPDCLAPGGYACRNTDTTHAGRLAISTEGASIHLQFVGRVPAKLAREMEVGGRLMWNGGGTSTIVSLTPKGKKSVTVVERCNPKLPGEAPSCTRTGECPTHERVMRLDRLAAYSTPAEAAEADRLVARVVERFNAAKAAKAARVAGGESLEVPAPADTATTVDADQAAAAPAVTVRPWMTLAHAGQGESPEQVPAPADTATTADAPATTSADVLVAELVTAVHAAIDEAEAVAPVDELSAADLAGQPRADVAARAQAAAEEVPTVGQWPGDGLAPATASADVSHVPYGSVSGKRCQADGKPWPCPALAADLARLRLDLGVRGRDDRPDPTVVGPVAEDPEAWLERPRTVEVPYALLPDGDQQYATHTSYAEAVALAGGTIPAPIMLAGNRVEAALRIGARKGEYQHQWLAVVYLGDDRDTEARYAVTLAYWSPEVGRYCAREGDYDLTHADALALLVERAAIERKHGR